MVCWMGGDCGYFSARTGIGKNGRGLCTKMVFFKDSLENFLVPAQVVHHGDFVPDHPFAFITSHSFSPAFRNRTSTYFPLNRAP